jgi:hypothetical protein
MKSHLPVEPMSIDVVGRHEFLWTIKVQLELMVIPDSWYISDPIIRAVSTITANVAVFGTQACSQNGFVTAVLLPSQGLCNGLCCWLLLKVDAAISE